MSVLDMATERMLRAFAEREGPERGIEGDYWNAKWTRDYLLSVFRYESDTGRLIWKSNGQEAGVSVAAGDLVYKRVRLDGKQAAVHRIIWAMAKGAPPIGWTIDHQDGDGLNNRIDNLRLAGMRSQGRNKKLGKQKWGAFGVYKMHFGKWRAYIILNRHKVCLGVFKSETDAIAARKRAEELLGFHQNHGRQKMAKNKG